MAQQAARFEAVMSAINAPSRSFEYPKHANGKPKYPSEIFGENVFNLSKLANTLPKPVYAKFIQQGRQTMDRSTADAVAHAVRVWAMDRGCTHFTHWFQPQTDSTAEKHDSFLCLKTVMSGGVEEITPIDAFSGSQLLQSEPDASSFPNGGMRTTFEARGYTIWDTTSPMFVRPGPHGTSVLYIPSVFISYNGEALDEKTVLLRSTEAVNTAVLKLLRVLGDSEVKSVQTTLGTEQEFFLIDRGLYNLRPDLRICGRTLVGSIPPKHQQLEDHYFGKVPSRVLATISEAELELYKLGVPIKTRHNEVAPAQFEVAPIFEEATVAVDHNMLTMDTLHKVAHRYKLKALFHEKPFKGVNGSGKHCNWSMATDTGDNLLEPTVKPETNYRFLIVLVAILNAVHNHGGLLRAGIASSSNEHRLGANEAPPGIVSAFLGEHLNEVLDAIESNRELHSFSQPQLQSVKLGGTVLDLKVATLPTIARDLTDRNRTSPFAFTGNKFEFRAVGSKQSPSFPVSLLNAAVAASMAEVTDALLAAKGAKEFCSDEDKLAVIRQFIKKSKPIRFEGNNYSQEWVVEAEKRGLPNIKTCPVAFKQILEPKNAAMLSKTGVISEVEIKSRYHVLVERYVKDLLIEGNTLTGIVSQSILPSAYEYRRDLSTTLRNLKEAGLKIDDQPEFRIFNDVAASVAALSAALAKVHKIIDQIHELGNPEAEAEVASKELTVAMDLVRQQSDALEAILPDKLWPLPKYSEILF